MSEVKDGISAHLASRDELMRAQERVYWAHRCRIKAAHAEHEGAHGIAHALAEMAREIQSNEGREER